MSRVYWDTMLFVYWLEDHVEYGKQVEAIYERMTIRGDILCTSTFTVGEVLVGPRKQNDSESERRILEFFESGGVTLLPFTLRSAQAYASIRFLTRASPADSIHLASAAAEGIDLFLTNDLKVRKQVVPGIQFIDGLGTTVLG